MLSFRITSMTEEEQEKGERREACWLAGWLAGWLGEGHLHVFYVSGRVWEVQLYVLAAH